MIVLAGWTRALRYQQAKTQMGWARDVQEPLARAIGIAEILGGIGRFVLALSNGGRLLNLVEFLVLK